jgi:hypothetical protein
MLVGVALVLAYAVVAGVTIGGSGRHVRPLFEGVGPSAPYQWVAPPPAFAAANVKPHPTESRFALAPAGSALLGFATGDAQLTVNLLPGAIPAREGSTEVLARATPLDPASLGPVPPGVRADGNAYRVELSYQPTGEPIATLAKPGNVVLTVPAPAQGLLFSPDGRTWQPLATQSVGATDTVGSTLSQTGYYLAVTSSTTGSAASGGKKSGGTGGVVVVAALTAVVALGLGFGPALTRRARSRRKRRRR